MNTRDLVYIPLAALTSPFWARKSRSGWRARFGHVAPGGASKTNLPRLLVHAVSVGEVNALRTLVPLLRDEVDLWISVTTDTGIARARSLFEGDATIVRFPLDFSWSVKRFIDAVAPQAIALVELELWPNFVDACHRRGIPVAVINGRLSERSFRGYKRIRSLVRPAFEKLSFAAVQDEAYAARFESLGVGPHRCLITGSMKWDAATLVADSAAAQSLAGLLGLDAARPLIVAGSTAPGEEAMLHSATPPGVQLLCAPRKPEWFDQAAAALPGAVRRSEHRPGPEGSERFLLDSIGELRHAYSLADVVVMGRSFGDLYGSDPIEPIALGKPTVIGPAVDDFRTIVDLLDRDGGIVRATAAELPHTLRSLLDDPDRRAEVARRGRDCIKGQQGASARHRKLLMGLLDRSRETSDRVEPEARGRLRSHSAAPEPTGAGPRV